MRDVYSLVLRMKRGDDRAFEVIVKRFAPVLKANSSRRGYFEEDCYQECLIKLYKGLKRYEKIN
ncbi:RNA polymerase sigma factor [Enterococcus sp. AZ196]|uniref:RNA polymerase sigma factor n=1 Tax=Enterococcus sp. AZ196 TaxID=2774659 RepID=UPI003D2A039C